MKRLLTVCALVGLMLSVGLVAAQSTTPRFEETECEVSLSSTDGVTCGNLIVPEDYSQPDGATIAVPVVRIASLSAAPAPDPFVMLQGGPGGSTIDAFTEQMINHPLRETRDIYLIDQRGTLYAEPYLFCDEIYQLTLDTLTVDLSNEEANEQYLAALNSCVERFAEDGVNFSNYDTLAYARDVASLREVFGYQEYNLYGVSYGTQLAQFVMANFPKGVRSVILDAVVPLDVNDNFLIEKRADRVFDALFDACAADADCNEAYPNLKEVFYQTVRDLNDNPAETQIFDPNTGDLRDALVDGDTLVSFLFQSMYVTSFIPSMPEQIFNFSQGNFEFFTSIAGFFVLDQTFADAQFWSTNCADDPVANEEDGIINDDISPEVLAWNEGGDEATAEACTIIAVEDLGELSDVPVTSEIPTLVMEGHFDPITPPIFGERVAGYLPNSFYYEFPGIGHGSFGEACPDFIVSQFLDDPTQEPDASCMADMPVEFITPLTEVTMTDYSSEELGISGIVPEGWTEMSPGIFQRYILADAPFFGYRVPDDGLEGYTERIIQGGYGYEELPDAVDTITTESNGLTWNLYEIEGQGLFAMFAFTEAEDGTAYVAVVASQIEADRALLVEDALRPALESFVPRQ